MNKFKLHISAIWLLLFIWPNVINAQMSQPQSRTYEANVRGLVHLLEGSVSDTAIDLSMSQGHISALTMTIVHGEIRLGFDLTNEWPDELKQNRFEIEATLSLNGELLPILPDQFFGDYGSQLELAENNSIEFNISGLIERFTDIQGVLEINISVLHSFIVRPDFKFSCEDGRPSFNFGDKAPYFIGIGLGAGLITWGAITESNAQDKHKEYWNLDDEVEANRLYEDANKEHKQGVGLMAAGGAIVVASGVLYFIRHRNFKRSAYMYETYCQEGNSIGIRPAIEIPNSSISGGSAGLSLVYTF